MELALLNENGLVSVEGQAGQTFMARAEDVDRLIETCFAEGANAALLYATNLSPHFSDVSSGEAGSILQKLRNYHIRLAVVHEPDRVTLGKRFNEMAEEETRGSQFGFFTTREAALDWLRQRATQ